MASLDKSDLKFESTSLKTLFSNIPFSSTRGNIAMLMEMPLQRVPNGDQNQARNGQV